MSRASGLAIVALAAAAVACASGTASVEPPPPAARTLDAADGADAPIAASPDGGGRDADVPIAAASRITREMLETDLRVLAQPRNHTTAPAGLAAAARHIATELEASGYTVARAPVTFKKAHADNVIGEHRGTDGSRTLLVGGHYDAVPGTPGADDNASGVAAALAVARALAAAPPMRATVRVVAFAFEEVGLVGSDAYARSLSADDRSRIAAVINLDMVGFRSASPGTQLDPLDRARPKDERKRLAADFIAVWAHPAARETLTALGAARRFTPDLHVETMIVPEALLASAPDLIRSDHASFWAVGVPAVSIVDTADARSPHYHKKTDTVETLDLDFATSVARWIAAAMILLDG